MELKLDKAEINIELNNMELSKCKAFSKVDRD